MKINLGNVRFVRKDKTLFANPHKTIMEHEATGYVYVDNVEGVAILPYRMGANGTEILVRDEYTPLHNTVLSIITGRRDPEDKDWRSTARRELLEEAGILAEERWFTELGEILPSGSHKRPDMLCIVDVTGMHQGRPTTDGSIFEKKSSNMWVNTGELYRMIREPNGIPDAYFLAAVTKYLVWCGLMNKSEETDLEKAKKGEERPGHKYIRREGSSGKYKYIYQEPKAKGPKKPDEKKGKKGGIMEQLAALLGKKQGGEEEKKPKKQLPWDEFNTVPAELGEFKKGWTAAQWMNALSYSADREYSRAIADLDDADNDLFNDPKKPNSLKISAAVKMVEGSRKAFSMSSAQMQELNVDNKKLDDRAQSEVKKAIHNASLTYTVVKHLTTIYNGSLVEDTFNNISMKMNESTWKKSHYKHLEKMSTLISVTRNTLEELADVMHDNKWLKGSDPKLDFMNDQVFEATDELMKARNKFVKKGFQFYIDQLSPLADSLKDNEELESAIELYDQLEIFASEVAYSSATSKTLGVFANQWNMKQRGIYDGVRRFSADVSGKLIDKVRSLDSIGDDDILQQHIDNLAKKEGMSFLAMGAGENPFGISEQVFSYIDMHGMDKYYRDMVFLTGGKTMKYGKEENSKMVNVLTKAYNGEDVYSDEDALDLSTKHDGGIGVQRRGPHAAYYTALNTMLLLNKNTPDGSKIPAFVRMWSSASHGSVISNAIEAMVESRGVDRGSYVNYHIASNRTVQPRSAKVRDALSDTITRVYKDTQNNMAKDYSADAKVQLFRGNGDAEVKSSVSSWTPVDHIAAHFGPVVSKVDAPIKSVLLAVTAENEDYWTYPAEKEFVLMPGLLSAEERLRPEALMPDQRQKILDRELEKQAELYGEAY